MFISSPNFFTIIIIIQTFSLCNSNNPSTKLDDDHHTTTSQQFWEFDDQSETWVKAKLPYDLINCINGHCTVVGSIQRSGLLIHNSNVEHDHKHDHVNSPPPLPLQQPIVVRRRISITRMSEASTWVTGPSGSIFERFWNGVQWVIAPHDLQVSAGHGVSVFIVNQTIIALSEPGHLFQLRLTEESQPVWAELDKQVQISSGILSADKKRLYFCTKNGTLLELLGGIDSPTMWVNHGRPPGAALVGIADGSGFKTGLVFTVRGSLRVRSYIKTSVEKAHTSRRIKGLISIQGM